MCLLTALYYRLFPTRDKVAIWKLNGLATYSAIRNHAPLRLFD